MQFVVKNKMINEKFGIYDLALKLKKGSLALFPTDTLPALCSCPKYSKKIWTIKKRPLSKPLILMGGCLDDLFEFVHPCALEESLQFAKIYGPAFDIQLFIELANNNPASQSLSRDLFIGSTAVFVWIISESKRLEMKNLWIIILTTFTIAFAFSAPLFLYLRELRIEEMNRD